MVKKSLSMFQRRRIWDNEVGNKRSAAVIKAGEYLRRKSRTRLSRFIAIYFIAILIIVMLFMWR